MAGKVEGTQLHAVDIVLIFVYFAVILFVGLWSARSNRGSVGGYFLAGRSMGWIPVGASLFASNIGSLHFVGLAGSGASTGISVALYELNAIYVLIMLGWLFLPVYIASGVFTMPEYLRKRFGGQRIRMYFAVFSLIMYIFTKISADLYAGAIFIQQALRWNIYAAMFFLLAIAAIFTVLGGLTAVMWTDFAQTIVMLIGGISLTILAFVKVGGYENLKFLYMRAVPAETMAGNTTCGYPRDDAFHLFRDPVNSDIPWPSMPGLLLNSIWYWCADQVIVQRGLAGKNYTHSKAGTLLAGYLKFLPMFIIIFPGMIARVLFPDTLACTDPNECERLCGSRSGCSNIAYPMLVLNLMPDGARGLMMAVMLSALMSSLTSIFNSSSTIFTIDLWRKFRKQASESELLIVGRVCVLVLVVVSVLWVPVINATQGGQLFTYIQQVSSFLQPPICAVYLLAIFWERMNEKAAFWTLISGLVVGSTRFILEMIYQPPACGQPDTRPNMIKNFHYLYFGMFLFAFSCIVAVVITLITAPIPKKHLYRLTFWSRWSSTPREDVDNSSLIAHTERRADDDEQDDTPVPWYRRAFNWICGIENRSNRTYEDEVESSAKFLSIEEKPMWKNFCDINAIILMTIAAFLLGFFY